MAICCWPCPNFASYAPGAAKPVVPGRFVKIGKDRKVRDLFECPVLAETGRACPMGVEFGPAGELYVVDNQNWAAGNGPNGEVNQGRILRLRLDGDKLVETTVLAKGISHPNGLRYRNGEVYVTVSKLPKVKRSDGLMVSAVYRFPVGGRDIQVNNTLDDPNLLASFVTENKYAQYGLDGIVFDSRGNLFVGNFGDGAIHKLTFDEKEQPHRQYGFRQNRSRLLARSQAARFPGQSHRRQDAHHGWNVRRRGRQHLCRRLFQ